ncbi:MAG: HEPN domain-containing protein [Patescibacteria group bacterium]
MAAPVRAREAENLLRAARHDLLAAEILADAGGELGDNLVYRAQQAAEKALKGFLAAQGVDYAKAKSIEALLALAAGMRPVFAETASAGLYNTQTACAQAGRIYAAVLANLPDEVRQAFED